MPVTNHQEVVKALLAKNAVDFKAIGAVVGELGPSVALLDDPWDYFCGTMRRFIRLHRLDTNMNPVEQLGDLATIAGELKGGTR
jgi:hypothetical protein